MLPLRYPWFWLAVGWVLAAGVSVGSLIPSDMVAGISAFDKLIHAGSYFTLMIWFAGAYEARRHVFIAVVLIAAGTGLDLVQNLTATRTFSMFDVFANSVGVAVGLVLAWLGLGGWCLRLERFWFA
jgi:VanZ family protein